MKNEKKLTPKERMEAEARIAALRAEANSISRTLKKDDEIGKPVEAPAEEVPEEETPVEVVAEEVPEEEAPVEAPAEEVPEEETPVEVVAEEVPEEETPVEVVAEEVTDEEAPVEAPAEEVPEEEAPVEASAEEVPEEETPVEALAEEVTEGQAIVEAPAKENGFIKFLKWFGAIVGIGALAGIFIMLMVMQFGKGNQVIDNDDAFDMDAFVASTVNIANQFTTDEEVATNVDVFAEKIGEDKLEELVEKYGELPVQKAIAEYIVFVPEIKMNQYVNNNGLVYNPNAADDYYKMLDNADKAYTDATGKNPNGALMSLEGYDTYKSNREAMKALIAESGDIALLTWYEVKTTGYDAMVQQNNDTTVALDYKEEVKLELVNNVNGSVKLLELQLEQNVNGTDADTLKYTDVYAEFIINNYMYVVAN